MRSSLFIILSFFSTMPVISQIILERQSLSCLGLNMCSDQCILSTGGQIDYQLCTNGTYSLTTGFEQPEGPLSMTVTLDVELDECTGFYTVEITYVSACNEADSMTYFWNGVEGNYSVSGLPAITTLEIISDGGCEYSSTFDFVQMDVASTPCELEFFSFLSPNNDGENDQWNIGRITQAEFSGNNVKLFNRWGSIVWEVEGYDNTDKVWKGENNHGDLLPDGTYFYLVEADGKKFNGYVELMR